MEMSSSFVPGKVLMILVNVSASMNMYVISAGFLTAAHERASERGREAGGWGGELNT